MIWHYVAFGAVGIMLHYVAFDITNIMWHLALWCDIMIGIGEGGVEVELMAYWGRRD